MLSLCVVLLIALSTQIHKIDPKDKILEYEKTQCFGSCPVYTATIYKDGTVVYNGLMYVKNEGKKVYKLSKDDMNDIYTKLNEDDIMKYSNNYDAEVTDLPSTYLILFKDGRVIKKIHMRANVPNYLNNLSNLIHNKLSKKGGFDEHHHGSIKV